jgi:hypothetical protein
MTPKTSTPATNLALLQWLVVDVAGQCSLITIARRTRQTSSDKSATASNADRYKTIAIVISHKLTHPARSKDITQQFITYTCLQCA